MKQEDKVPTLEQCQRLKELGVVLETEKYWVQLRTDKSWHLIRFVSGTSYDDRIFDYSNRIPAPDIGELGEIFYELCAVIFYSNGQNKLTVQLKQGGKTLGFFYGETEAQAKCSALIWLIENKHFNPKDLKLY